jgi:hypothetical protein
MQHVTVYREEGRFAGWPANHGIWSWGDEIVAGFIVGYSMRTKGFHACDGTRPFVPMQARSLDGGETWKVRGMALRTPGNRGISADEHVSYDLSAKQAIEQEMENVPTACPGGIDFTHPNFALMCARTGLGAGTVSWFYVSYDRCRSWEGPYSLPMFDLSGIEARTDYLVSGPNECTLLLTAAKASGDEGGGVFCTRTTDAGKTFQFVSWVVQTDEGFAIMPSSVRLSESRILTTVRRREEGAFTETQSWIDLYGSDDNGRTWDHICRPVPDTGRGGNPPALLKLRDGRLCLVYGYRDKPYGIHARISTDKGESWSDEIVLRHDGGSHDIGYPRAVQRSDGTVIVVYYYNQESEGERYIAATLWKP